MKELSPMQVKTSDDICLLRTDNHVLKNYWICFNNEDEISITKQRNGEPATESITIDRKSFHRLLEWYQKPQKMRKG